MNKKETKRFLQIYTNIRRHVIDGKHCCMCKFCHENAINSHLLQRHGILSRIFEDGHVYEPKQNDLLNDGFHSKPFGFKKVGINKALSVSLFCNKHDTNIFKEIECKKTDLSTYKSHLLLTYRTTCAEKRRKDMEIEICNRVLNSNEYKHKFGNRLEFFKDFQDGFVLGNRDLEKYIDKLEEEIRNPKDSFAFYEYDFPISGIYASSTFSLTDYTNMLDKEMPLALFVLHIIPVETGSKIILGYEKQNVQPWQVNYIERISSANNSNIEEYLTSLLIRINGWGISQNVYYKLEDDKLDYFFQKFQEDIYNIDSEEYKFNLFDGALLNEYSENKELTKSKT